MPLLGTFNRTTYGTSNPLVGQGEDGDVYIRSVGDVDLDVWKKESGVWTHIGDFNPNGWIAFNPTVAAESGTIVSLFGQDGAYKIVGDTVSIWANAGINDAGTGAGALVFGLPVAIWMAAGSAFWGQLLTVRVFDNWVAKPNNAGVGFFVSGGSGNYDRIFAYKYDGTTPIKSGNGIYISGTYQKA